MAYFSGSPHELAVAGIGAEVVGLALVVHPGCCILLMVFSPSESPPEISVISKGSIGYISAGCQGRGEASQKGTLLLPHFALLFNFLSQWSYQG